MDTATWQAPIEDLTDRELDILRHVADGLSNREIAQELFLSHNTVKWHNRKIYEKLGVDSRTQAIARAHDQGMLDADKPGPDRGAAKQIRQHNLPVSLTSFIGRAQEIADIKTLLEDAHLITLTGPAGTGKTRLAIHAATVLAEAGAFTDGVFLVELAPLSDTDAVGEAIVETLGVMAIAGQASDKVLRKYLASRHLLLVLDNFEHLLNAAPLIGDLLSISPNLRVLVTSREPLSLYGEQEYPVPPLRTPEHGESISPASLSDYEAASLFVQRAQAVNPDFMLTAENASAVAEIIARLDGLPLAIELAAARVKLFSPQALQGQLEHRLDALGSGPRHLPERQRTLRAAIDWSYNLLDDDERTLLARLSVFQGGRTIEAAEAVCCHDLALDVVDGLSSLLNKNLLRHEEGPEGEPRFVMLETIHEYGRDCLRERGETADIQRHHAEYFVAFAERAEPFTRGGPDQLHWLRQLEADHGNLRIAYRWAKNSATELALRLAAALGYFWFRQGHYAEGQQWTSWALDASQDAPAPVRADICAAAGLVSFYLNDPVIGKQVLSEAVALYRELGNRRHEGWALIKLSMQSITRPEEYQNADVLAQEGLALLREVDDKPGIIQALNNLGERARFRGDLLRARQIYGEALDIARETGDELMEGIVASNLGLVALQEGDPARAQALLRQVLRMAHETGRIVKDIIVLDFLVLAAEGMGDLPRAARLIGAAEGFYDAVGFVPQPGDLPEIERGRASVREQLGAAAFDALYAEGQAMSLDEAVAYAMEESDSEM